MTKTAYEIDAKGKKLGRLASEVAKILMGKDSLDFARNKVPNVKIIISNASKIDISAKKLSDRRYESYSGFPGGLKIKSAEEIIKTSGFEGLIKNAVKGMLPRNKLRSKMLQNLEVTN